MQQINWGDLTPEQFIAEYWQKRPLLIRNAFVEFEPVIEPDELAGLALEPEVESRLIRYTPGGKDYSLRKGPFTEADFSQLPESHWTLLVQAVDHYVDAAAELLECFNFIPRWRIDDLMISYATIGGGVGPHYDNYDVFLLQAQGTRRWEIGQAESSDSARIPDLPLMILSDFKALDSFELDPGDMLYLPPQISHNGIATSADCVTYSIGFRAPSDAEMLRSFSDQIGETLKSEARYQDPDLSMTERLGEIDSRALARVQSRLSALLDNPKALAQWFGQFVSEPKYPDDLYQPDQEETVEWLEGVDADEGVYVLPGARLFYIDTPEQLLLFCNGTALNTAGCDQNWIRRLCDDRQSGPIEDSSTHRALMRQLHQSGGID